MDETDTTPLTEQPARSVVPRIQAALPSLVPSDARVARLILDSPDAVIYQSVTEFAAAADVSTATVIRCAKKLGFKGFHDLKLTLAQDLAAFRHFSGEPKEASVLERVTAAGAQSVRDASALVDPLAFEAAVDALGRARRVLFVGVGTSAPLAQDAAYRFRAIGLDTHAPADAHVQHVSARLLEAGDVCLAVSHTGSTRETLAAIGAAKTAGATTVLITSFLRSPLSDIADFVLTAGSREVSFHLEAVASRLAHLAVIDALLVAVAEQDEKRSQRALDLYADVLSEHRL
jgi:RpiR family transcriptional regulator, carbohydrate utilization regulator